jgi:restriction endonuclease S subunit
MIKTFDLIDLCEMVTDGTHYTPPDIGKGHPFLTVTDMNGEDLDFRGCAKISRVEFEAARAQQSVPKLGDVLFSKDGTVGKVHVVGETEPFAVLSSIAIIRPDRGRLDARYLGYFLRTPHALAEATRRRTGSALRRIILKDLKRLPVPAPPLPEQRRIAAILDKADVIRRKRGKAIKEADKLLRATFLDMFGDPTANPRGFEICPVERVLSRIRPGTQSGPFGSALKKVEYVDDGVPVWTIENVENDRFRPDPRLFITLCKFEQLRRYDVRQGDILISRAGTVGRLCIAEPNVSASIINTNLVRVSLDSRAMRPEFFVTLFTSFPDRLSRLRANQKDNSFSFLNPATLRTIRIPKPPAELQNRFADFYWAIRRTRDLLEAGCTANDELFLSLLQRAFRGQL